MRFFIGMLAHETNTFSSIPTDRRQFEAHDLRYGGELLEAYRDTGTCLGGMIAAAHAQNIALAPSLAATASPAGRVTKEFYAEARDRLLADLKTAGPLDGVLLDLHGAMVCEGYDDGEGELLRRIRNVAPHVPIGVALDMHTNLFPAMAAHATVIAGYQTYPHVDMYDTGMRAGRPVLAMPRTNCGPTP